MFSTAPAREISGHSKIGLHSSFILPKRDTQNVHFFIRVFRRSRYVVWARALTNHERGISTVILENSHSSRVVLASTPGRYTGKLQICSYAVSDGSLISCGIERKPQISLILYMVPVSDTAVLMPGRIPAFGGKPDVVRLELRMVKKIRYHSGSVIPLTGEGNAHPADRLYGDVDIMTGIYCFLTMNRYPYDRKKKRHEYDLYIHCFDVNNNLTPKARRVRKLVIVPTCLTLKFATVPVGTGFVYVACEHTISRNRRLVSESIVHRLNVSFPLLQTLSWRCRTSRTKNFRNLLKYEHDRRQGLQTTEAESPLHITQITILPRNAGLALRI